MFITASVHKAGIGCISFAHSCTVVVLTLNKNVFNAHLFSLNNIITLICYIKNTSSCISQHNYIALRRAVEIANYE